ncbi:hypothetical protein GCM10023237_40330 [Streptomyces coeruleoprunus]
MSSALTTAALVIVSWKALPADTARRASDRHRPAQAPTQPPATGARGIETGALLPPSGVPYHAKASWKEVRTSTDSPQPLLAPTGHCPVEQPGGHPDRRRPTAQASRDYRSTSVSSGTARHALATYADAGSAGAAAASLDRVLRDRCELTWAAMGSAQLYTRPGDGARPAVEIVVMRSGKALSVVHTEGRVLFGSGYVDGPALRCMRMSLARLDPAAATPPEDAEDRAAREQKRC